MSLTLDESIPPSFCITNVRVLVVVTRQDDGGELIQVSGELPSHACYF